MAAMSESLRAAAALLHPEPGGEVMVCPAPAGSPERWASQPGWGAQLAECLAPGGLAYVLARPAQRAGLRRALGQDGLEVAEQRLHLPVWNGGQALVPLAAGPVRYAVTMLLPRTSPRARLAARLGAWPG